MYYVIVRYHKPIEQNRKKLDNTTDNYSAHSNTSYSYDKLNENTDINSKKSINCRDTFF